MKYLVCAIALLAISPAYATNIADPSVGANGAAAPAYSTQVGCPDGSGNLQANSVANPCTQKIIGQDGITAQSPSNPFATTPYDSNGVQANFSTQVPTQSVNDYPAGATPETASATGTTAATTATLAAAPNRITYICGVSIRANATGAATGFATITGTISGTLSFLQWTAPLASGIGNTDPNLGGGGKCIPASGANQAIAVISAAPGSGGNVSVTAWGYQL